LILLNVGSILLAIGFHKIYKSYFTFELLLGLFGGLVVINYLVSTYYKDLIEANAVKNIGKIKDILSQIRKNSISFLFFPFLFVILIISTFSTQSVSQIISGIGIVYISSIIIIWTTFTAFVNEVFLLPILYERKD
jgi:hypothetical protein